MSCAQTWMRLFNWLMILQGLIIGAFTTYIGIKAFSSFVYVLGGFGLYVLIVGILGVSMNNSRRRGCVNLYSVLFFLLIAAHALIAVGFLFYEHKTVEILKDLNSSHNQDISDYIDNHRNGFKVGSVIVLSIEGFTWLLSIFAARSVSGALDHDHGLYFEQDSVGLVSSEVHYEPPVSATPQTDAHRARLSEKYGHVFGSSRQQQANTNGVYQQL